MSVCSSMCPLSLDAHFLFNLWIMLTVVVGFISAPSSFLLILRLHCFISWVKLGVLRRFGHAHPCFQVCEPEISSSLCLPSLRCIVLFVFFYWWCFLLFLLILFINSVISRLSSTLPTFFSKPSLFSLFHPYYRHHCGHEHFLKTRAL